MFEKLPRYYTFILRFWEERNETSPSTSWRFTLEDPEHHVRYGFSSLEELTAFLQKRCSDSSIESNSPDATD